MYQQLSDYLKILADPSRLEILDLLSCDELCACDLLAHFHFSQPTLSHHMKVLARYQLVQSRKNGTKTMYRLNKERLEEITSQLSSIGAATSPCVCDQLEKGTCET